jgi:hypothetical protein
MSTYTSNSVVLVERHYIPLELYQQLYTPPRLPQSMSNLVTPPTVTVTSSANGDYSHRTARAARPTTGSATGATGGSAGNLFQTVMENFFPQSSSQTANTSVNQTTSNVTASSSGNGNTRRVVVSDVYMDTFDIGSSGLNSREDGMLLFNTLFRAAMGGGSNQGSSQGLTRTEISRNSETYEITGNSAPYSTQGGAVTCSICTSEYESGDDIRRLNRCRHEFHETCIDTWLADHNNCPVCRTEVIANINNID